MYGRAKKTVADEMNGREFGQHASGNPGPRDVKGMKGAAKAVRELDLVGSVKRTLPEDM